MNRRNFLKTVLAAPLAPLASRLPASAPELQPAGGGDVR